MLTCPTFVSGASSWIEVDSLNASEATELVEDAAYPLYAQSGQAAIHLARNSFTELEGLLPQGKRVRGKQPVIGGMLAHDEGKDRLGASEVVPRRRRSI